MNITYKSIAEKESGKTFPLLQGEISSRWLAAAWQNAILPRFISLFSSYCKESCFGSKM